MSTTPYRAHQDGRKAFKAGIPQSANPHDQNGGQYGERGLLFWNWDNGWRFEWFKAGQEKLRRGRK